MHIGHYISGAAHIGVLGWALIGGAFTSEPPELEVSPVALISPQEFAALQAQVQPPEVSEDVSLPEAPSSEPNAPELLSEPDEAPAFPQPDAAETPAPDAAPDLTELIPPEPEGVETDIAVLTPPTEDEAIDAAPSVTPAPAAKADRVAPEAAPAPSVEAAIADTLREATQPDESPTPVEEVEDTTAPEAATTQILPDATAEPNLAPAASIRPKLRPRRAEPEPENSTDAAVAAALAEAGSEKPVPRTPSGPPLTQGERDALRVAVGACWNVNPGSPADQVIVVVGVELDQQGKVVGEVRQLSATGGDDRAKRTAYEAARRAVLRCGAKGFDLPKDKYDYWREIEMTFNPEKMRRR